jgi:hypothetical protein
MCDLELLSSAHTSFFSPKHNFHTLFPAVHRTQQHILSISCNCNGCTCFENLDLGTKTLIGFAVSVVNDFFRSISSVGLSRLRSSILK